MPEPLGHFSSMYLVIRQLQKQIQAHGSGAVTGNAAHFPIPDPELLRTRSEAFV